MESGRKQEEEEFLQRAKEAALWILERDNDPPELIKVGDSYDFLEAGLQFRYRPEGWHYNDNPWREDNMRRVEHREGLVVIAKCPRHGGSRVSFTIPTMPLRVMERFGRFIRCTLCSEKTVVVRLPERPCPGGGTYMAANYCANCAKRRFGIPESRWLKEPPRWLEDDLRRPTREALADIKQWSQDVECDRCVIWVCVASGMASTHAVPRRTYQRD
ncbi:MAG: hypothetical protein HYT63_02830 [Candidatus Yanofskybacteria bacterium]|nr:hypothetical protein [Candidatus Yanofskybacteria bacterium]